jgi:hypothetical protein
MKCTIAIIVLATVASAMPQGGPGIGIGGPGIGHGGHGHGYEDHPAKYQYEYGVQDEYTHSNYGHSEHRDGHITEGTYFVSLPDGRTQRVHYTVNGDEGYVAEVTYEGEAQFGPGVGVFGGRGVGGPGLGGRGPGGPGIGGPGIGGPGIGGPGIGGPGGRGLGGF